MNNEIIKKIFNKKAAIVLIVAGIVILAVTGMFDSSEKAKKEEGNNQVNLKEYISELEERLKKVVESIDGAGKSRVMITLSESSEKSYATEEKNITDSQNDGEKYSKDYEKKYVIVNNSALLIKEFAPKICGVAVVCEGGADATVSANVTQAVSVLLGIPMKDIFVTKGA